MLEPSGQDGATVQRFLGALTGFRFFAPCVARGRGRRMLYERRDLTAPKVLCGLFGRGGPLEFPIVDGGGAGRAACVARRCEMSRF